jgi:hypothetical protein
MVPSDMSGGQGKGRLQFYILKTNLICDAGRLFVHASMTNFCTTFLASEDDLQGYAD